MKKGTGGQPFPTPSESAISKKNAAIEIAALA